MTQSFALFLASVEKKAFRMAMLAAQNNHDALDIVQDTMEKMVKYYISKPSEQWPPLFFKVLHNRIMDWHRKAKIRNLLFFWQQHESEEGDDYQAARECYQADEQTPEQLLTKNYDQTRMLVVIEQLPIRQQQCFLLRCWQGFSVTKTAEIMQCSEGSVKTHYSRAVNKIKQSLEVDHGE